MPEYLAPAVYIEEVPSANKPIEGVSTSTASMVGMAARGPCNTPTLVTSAGSYTRLFGGLLDPRVYTNALDSMPHAALGFFANGGSRLYVTRIVGDGATFASAEQVGAAPGATAGVTLAAAAAAGATTIALTDGSDVAADTTFLIVDGERSETVTTSGAPELTLLVLDGPVEQVANNTAVAAQTVTDGAAIPALENMVAGGTLQIGGVSALNAGDIVRLRSTDPDVDATEYVTIATDDTFDIVESGLRFGHPAASTEAHVVTFAAGNADQAAGVTLAGSSTVALDDASGFAADDVVTIGAGATRQIRTVTAVPPVAALEAALESPHALGVAVVQAAPMLRVHARYPGAWGNSMTVRASAASLLGTQLADPVPANASSVVLNSTFGLFAGSTLSVGDPGAVQTGVVTAVNHVTKEVTLADPLNPGIAAGAPVASAEFNLLVDRIENGKVVESESFTGLAMHANHPRYAGTSVGRFDRATGRASDLGGSELVRISDLTVDDDGVDVTDGADIRLGTPAVNAEWRMAGGDDDVANVDDTTFIGTFSDDPEDRTGIQALENEPSISLVAVPGRTSVPVQEALLTHAQKMVYRFAVIEPPPGAKINEARAHRQNFDRKNGAIYYPWINVADPFGGDGAITRVPPSGHTMGIIARTDMTRGVWKAPANEVVNGALRFDSALTKGEQDILNPVHVNCFRDFRTVNRGLRLYGARTLSSDPEWKYVNVRRLVLFIEQSLDNGLQWAVFEPNAEPLWASVKQSITNFLIGIWRDGGLEGVTQEEAFFVQVGYDVTMTQGDIDNGRMIVVVGVAPVKPAEFVIVRITQKTREATA